MPTPERIDELSPLDGVGVTSERIKLSLADPNSVARAFVAVSVAIDSTLCEPEGLVLPLLLTVTGPDNRWVLRRYMRRLVPSEVVFLPIQGGTHRVVLRELAHNRWWGRLTVEVVGEALGA